MKKPIWSWKNTLRTLGYKATRILNPTPKPAPSDLYRPSIDSIEPRQMLAGDIGIVNLDIVNDNGQYLTDHITSDPTIDGTVVTDDPTFDDYIVEVDWDSDNSIDAYAEVDQSGYFVFDVRSTSHIAYIDGTNTPQFRAVKDHLGPNREQGAWQGVTFERTLSDQGVIGINYQQDKINSGFRADLGTTVPGETTTETIQLVNRGASDLTLSETYTATAGFSINNYPGETTLTPGQTIDLTVSFTGSDFRDYVGYLIFSSTDNQIRPFQLGFSASIEQPELGITVDGQSFEENRLDFGNHSTSAPITKTIGVTNNGTSEVELNPVIDLPIGFTLTSAPQQLVLLAGQSTSFDVTFDPSAVGIFAGEMVLRHAGNNMEIFATEVVGEYLAPRLEMSLDGIEYSTDTNSIDFGTTRLNNLQLRPLWLRNSGSADVDIDNFEVPDGWQVLVAPPTSLAAGESAQMVIRYESTDPGYAVGEFSFDTNNEDLPSHTFYTFATTVSLADVRLFNDTGDNQTDTVTSDTRIAASILGGETAENIWIELTRDGQAYGDLIPVDHQGSWMQRVYMDIGEHQVGVRLVVEDGLGNVSETAWQYVDVDYDPESENNAILIQDVELKLNLGVGDEMESYDPTIIGTIVNDGNVANVDVYFDHNADGEPDGYTTTDELGNFEYTPVGLEPGFITVDVWASESMPDGSDQLSEDSTFEFTLISAPAATVNPISLEQDTGVAGDNATSVVKFLGSITTVTDAESYIVEWDLNGDGIAEGSVPVDENLDFEIEPFLFGPGDYEIRVRVIDLDYDATSAWSDPNEFTLESMRLPTFTDVELVDNTGDPADAITANADVTGVIESEYGIISRTIQFDTNQDGLADAETYTDENGRFVFSPDVSYGEVVLNYRSTIFDEVTSEVIVGDWNEISFTYEPDGEGTIENFQLLNNEGVGGVNESSDPTVTGLATYDGSIYAFAQIEFDYDNDNEIDASIFANEIGVFQHQVNVDFGVHTVRARVKTYDVTQNEFFLGDWASLEFEYLEADHTSMTGPEGGKQLLDFGNLDAVTDKQTYQSTLEIAIDAFNQHILGGEIFGSNSLTSTEIDNINGFDFAFAMLKPLTESISFSGGEYHNYSFQNEHLRDETGANNPINTSLISLDELFDYSYSIAILVDDSGQRVDGDLVFSFDTDIDSLNKHTAVINIDFDFDIIDLSTSGILHEGSYSLQINGSHNGPESGGGKQPGGGGGLPGGQDPSENPIVGDPHPTIYDLEETGSFKSFHSYELGATGNGGVVTIESTYSLDNDYANHVSESPFQNANDNNFAREETIEHKIEYNGEKEYSDTFGSSKLEGTIVDDFSIEQTITFKTDGEYRSTGTYDQETTNFEYTVDSTYDRTKTDSGTYESEGPTGKHSGTRTEILTEHFELTSTETGSYIRDDLTFDSINNQFEQQTSGWEIVDSDANGTIVKNETIFAEGQNNPDTHKATTQGKYDYDNQYSSHFVGSYSVDPSGFQSSATKSIGDSYAFDALSISLDGTRQSYHDGLNSKIDYDIDYIDSTESTSNHDGTFVNIDGAVTINGHSSSNSKHESTLTNISNGTFASVHTPLEDPTHTGTTEFDSKIWTYSENTDEYDVDTDGGIDITNGKFHSLTHVTVDETTKLTNTYNQHQQPRKITSPIQGQLGETTSGQSLPSDMLISGTSNSTNVEHYSSKITDDGTYHSTSEIESRSDGTLIQEREETTNLDAYSKLTFEYTEGTTFTKNEIESTDVSSRTFEYNDNGTYVRYTWDGDLQPPGQPGSGAEPGETITGTFTNFEEIESSSDSKINGSSTSDYVVAIETTTLESDDFQSMKSTFNESGSYTSVDGEKEGNGTFDLLTTTYFASEGKSTLQYDLLTPNSDPIIPRPVTLGTPVTEESSFTTTNFSSIVDTTYKIEPGDGSFEIHKNGLRTEDADYSFTENRLQESDSTTNGTKTELHRLPYQSPSIQITEANGNAVDLTYYTYVESKLDLTTNEDGNYQITTDGKITSVDFDYEKDSFTHNKSKIDTWVVEDTHHGKEVAEVDSKITIDESGFGDYLLENTSTTPGPVKTTNRYYNLTQTTDTDSKVSI